MEWFSEDCMVFNADKCHSISLDIENAKFYFDGDAYFISKEETILSIMINNALSFDSHIKDVCKKASQKLAALSRLANYLHLEEKY